MDVLDAPRARLRSATDGWSRPALALAVVAALLLLGSIAFPFYALQPYQVSAERVEDPSAEHVVDYQTLDDRSQAVVRRAVAGEAVVLYAPYYSHQEADGLLPELFSDRWIDDHTPGAVVAYDGTHYEVTTFGAVPFHFALVVPAGLVLGGALLVLAVASNRREWRWAPLVGTTIGVGALGLLLWLANASGYVWPMQ